MIEPIENEYFNWLCAKVLERNNSNYVDLFKLLHKMHFTWVVLYDSNRVEDGLELRTDFLRETNSRRDPLWEDEPCSVLEVLIAFAMRASFLTEIPVRDWLLIFLANLKLDDYRHVYDTDIPVIESIVHTFMFRTYSPNGDGGLFPMRYTQYDQRENELWYQFNEYLVDRDIL